MQIPVIRKNDKKQRIKDVPETNLTNISHDHVSSLHDKGDLPCGSVPDYDAHSLALAGEGEDQEDLKLVDLTVRGSESHKGSVSVH